MGNSSFVNEASAKPRPRTVVITGVNSGIGRALSERFAAGGYRVLGTVRDLEEARTQSWPDAVHLGYLDLAQPDSIRAFAEEAMQDGVPDILINNAGGLQFAAVEDTSLKDMRRLFEVNVFGQLELIKEFLPAFRRRRGGVIVNVTSLGGRLVFPFFGNYNASKHAFEGFTEALWYELRPFGVRVKAVEPGFVETPIYDKAGVDEDQIDASPPYRKMQKLMVEFEQRIKNRTTPAEAAEQIWEAAHDDGDRMRYPVAAYARPLILGRRILGPELFMRIGYRRWFGRLDQS